MARIKRPPVAVSSFRISGLQQEGELRSQERERPLEHQHRDRGEAHADPQAGREGDGRGAVQHGFRVDDVRITGEPLLDGAEKGHGAHAEHQAGGDVAGDEGPGAGAGAGLQPLAGALQARLDPQKLPHHPAHHHAGDDDQDVADLQRHLHADEEGAEAQPRRDDPLQAFRQAVPDGQADPAPDQDRRHVHQRPAHTLTPDLPATRKSTAMASRTPRLESVNQAISWRLGG